MKRFGILVGGSVLFWFLLALPAHRIWGDSALVFSGAAILLCLIPTALTLLWGRWALGQSPEQQLLMVLGGTGVRMFFVLAGGLLLYLLVPYFQKQQSFWVWVLVSYLFTLALDTALVLSGKQTVTN
jgi:hypothetical protein